MALISCPECGKQISETTPSCPHCGYLLSADSSDKMPEPTKIGELQQNAGGGIGMILGGILGIPCSLILGPLFFIPMIGAFMLIVAGISQITGMRVVKCPYCGKSSKIGRNSEEYKCSFCKKPSVKKDDYLHPIQ